MSALVQALSAAYPEVSGDQSSRSASVRAQAIPWPGKPAPETSSGCAQHELGPALERDAAAAARPGTASGGHISWQAVAGKSKTTCQRKSSRSARQGLRTTRSAEWALPVKSPASSMFDARLPRTMYPAVDVLTF
jgi:hypothetical protein